MSPQLVLATILIIGDPPAQLPAPSDAVVHAPRDAQLQWQIELVNNEVQRLKEDARAAPYSRVGRVWWWWW